jgi:transposase
MGVSEEAGTLRPVRRWRSVSEKRRIADLTFEPGGSVALGARAQGVNANQLFKWRRALKWGELSEPLAAPPSLLHVIVSGPCEVASSTGGVDANE